MSRGRLSRPFFSVVSSARQLLLVELGFLTGVACGDLPRALLMVVGVFCFAVCCILLPRMRRSVPFVCLALLAGFFRFQQSEAWVSQDDLAALHGSTVTFIGTIAADVDERLDEQRLTLRAETLGNGDETIPVRGRVLAVTDRYPTYTYGTTLTVRCKLTAPEPVERFAYDEYLALARIYSLCRSPRITEVRPPEGSIPQVLYAFRGWVTQRISFALPEPHASLLAGILLGARRGIPDGLTNAFQRVGLSHVVALSGYNITILVTAVLSTTVRAGGSRRHAFWVATLVLVGFVVMTGAAPSVMRAGVMGFLVCVARYCGRLSRIWYSLVFAAALMVLLNPRVLLHDVGFQLSFLATVGLVLFSASFGNRLTFIPERFGLRDALAATLAATLATLPLLAAQFGRISLVGPLVNVLVVPIVPLIMLLGVGALLPFVAPLAAACEWALLTWMILCAEWFAGHGWASVDVPALSTWAPFGWYAVGILCYVLWKKTRTPVQRVP